MGTDANGLSWVKQKLHQGLAIPAHPLALTKSRKLDERRQAALTRYYHAAGAGGSRSACIPHSLRFDSLGMAFSSQSWNLRREPSPDVKPRAAPRPPGSGNMRPDSAGRQGSRIPLVRQDTMLG